MIKLVKALCFCAAAAMPLAAAAEGDEAPSLLFVEMAPKIAMADGVLTLDQPDDQLLWFSDRPKRLAGKISTETFLALWAQGEDSFAEDPPNATLFGMTDAGEVATVVTISNARKTEDGVAFDYAVLEGEAQPTWSDAALFIDSIGFNHEDVLAAMKAASGQFDESDSNRGAECLVDPSLPQCS